MKFSPLDGRDNGECNSVGLVEISKYLCHKTIYLLEQTCLTEFDIFITWGDFFRLVNSRYQNTSTDIAVISQPKTSWNPCAKTLCEILLFYPLAKGHVEFLCQNDLWEITTLLHGRMQSIMIYLSKILPK